MKILIMIIGVFSMLLVFYGAVLTVHAQSDLETIKYRNLVIDLGNGVKTNAQLTCPAVGKGPFPGVLLIQGTGPSDKNETLGPVLKNKPLPTQPLLQMSQYLSERGFAVLRYDKRGVGGNFTIVDKNVWENATIDDLIHDAAKALNVLVAQPDMNLSNNRNLIPCKYCYF